MNVYKNKFKKIKFLVFDFDGVFTNNSVWVDQDGKESICCSRYDGLGIEMLRRINFPLLVISREKNNVTKLRCKKLKINCISGVDNKLDILLKEAKRKEIPLRNVCYVGNDVNDIECLKKVGLAVAVADSHTSILKVADYATKSKGGHGAVREICDLVLTNSLVCRNRDVTLV